MPSSSAPPSRPTRLALIGSTVDDVVGELQALAPSLDEVPATPTDVAPPLPPVEPPKQAEREDEPPATTPVTPPYEGPMPDDPDPDPLERPASTDGDRHGHPAHDDLDDPTGMPRDLP